MEMISRGPQPARPCFMSPGSNESWIVVALLFSMILGGLEIPVFGRNPIVSPFDVLFSIVLLVFSCRSIVGDFRFNPPDKPIFYLALAFFFSQLISFLFNLRDVPRGFLAVKVFAFGYLSYLFCVSAVKRATEVQRILFSLIVWGATLSVFLAYLYISDWSSMIGQEGSYETKSEIGIAIGR